jgi:hypothetical protein
MPAGAYVTCLSPPLSSYRLALSAAMAVVSASVPAGAQPASVRGDPPVRPPEPAGAQRLDVPRGVAPPATADLLRELLRRQAGPDDLHRVDRQSAELSARSARFRTVRGLRVGDRSSSIRARHPNAEFRPPGFWALVLARFPFGAGDEPAPVLSALVRGGRVFALTGYIGGAGE